MPEEPAITRLAYRPAEAAKALGVSRSQVYAWIKEGKLNAKHFTEKLTLIPVGEIERMLAAA